MQEINFDVLNTLNIISPKLGEAYTTRGFNPFGEDFVLNYDKVTQYLVSKIEKNKIVVPEFMLESAEKMIDALKIGKQNTKVVIKLLQKIYKVTRNQKLNEEIANLKICLELLNSLPLDNLDFEDTLEVIRILETFDKVSAKLMKNSFDKKFNVQLAIAEFMKFCNQKQVEVCKVGTLLKEKEHITRQFVETKKQLDVQQIQTKFEEKNL